MTAEARPSAPPLPPEQSLCRHWWSRRYGTDTLVTSGRQVIQVVYPGRWCRTPGPDFRDAMVAFGPDLRHGDIEAHRRSSDWYTHGHHLQPAYNRVILHIVLNQDGPEAQTYQGHQIPTLLLPAVEPVPDPVPVPTCPAAAAGWDSQGLATLIDAMGEERVLARAAALAGDMAVQPPEQVLYEALCQALGYSRNQSPMRELARRLPLWLLEAAVRGCHGPEREAALEAILLGGAGLLPSQRPSGWETETDEYLEEAEQTWATVAAQWDLRPMEHRQWQFGHTRPGNRPTRRVAAAAWLVGRYGEDKLLPQLLEGVQRGPAALARTLEGEETEGYWRGRLDFGRPHRPGSLIGQGRAAELVINAIIPVAYAVGQERSDSGLCRAALACLHSYPYRGDNELTRHMAREILPLPVPPSACRQQGILHIYQRWCRDKHCDACPVSGGASG